MVIALVEMHNCENNKAGGEEPASPSNRKREKNTSQGVKVDD